MAAKLQSYQKYNPVQYDYVKSLPEGWKLLPNIAIFEERIERGYENEELLSVTIGKGVIKQSELEKKDSSTLDKSKYLLVYPGDLVYSMRFRQGASGYSQYKGIVSPACTVLKPRRNIQINPRFFYYMFRTGFYKNYIERFSYGIADGQIPLRYTDFKRMYSIVPPLAIQNAIVDYLDEKCKEIDRFIQNKERFVELMNEQKQNLIDEIVLGNFNITSKDFKTIEDLLKLFPQKFKWTKLKYITKIISKGTTPSTEGGNMTDEGIRFIKAENIANSIVNALPEFFIDEWTNRLLKRSQLEEGDLLMVIAGATIGRVAILDKQFLPANTNQAVSFIRLKKDVNRKFCFFWLQSKFVNTCIWLKAVQAAQPNIAMQDLGDLFIPALSDTIKSEIVSQIETEHERLNNAMQKAHSEIKAIKVYRETLINQMITGKLSPFATN